MKRHLLSYAAAAGLAFAASPAFATTVTHSVLLSGFTYGPANVVTVQSAAPGTVISPFNVYAGQYSGTLDGNSFFTYCAELTQSLSFNHLYSDYTIVSGITAFGADKSAVFDHVVSAILDQNINSNPDGSGFAQASIWEVLYETASTYAFSSGSFNVSNSNNIQIASGSTDWLGANAWPVHYHVDLLHSQTSQDLVLITRVTVPEPAPVALMLVGLVGLVVRRRSQRR